MRSISFTISIALLAAFYFATRDYPTAEKAEPYHAHILSRVESVPDMLGDWRTVDRPQPPPAAQQLLRPNSLLTRRLVKDDTAMNARLIVVQTKDSRDMGGHYPPVCYPSSGWQIDGAWPPPGEVTIPGIARPVPYQVYTFKQRAFPRDRRIKIYGFFAIPDNGFRTDIKSVRKAAEDYRVRPFGCAQIQVIVDADTPEDLGERIFVELLTPIAPLLNDLSGHPESALQAASQKAAP